MNLMSRTLTGTILLILGIILTTWGVFNKVSWVHGIIAIIIGIAILLNKEEDHIEKIKTRRHSKR